MNDRKTGRTPPNAFSRSYLERIREQDEPPGSAEADFAGPWKIEAVPGGGFAVLRQWEVVDEDPPEALCKEYELALKLLAVLPAVGREPLFWLAAEPSGPAGYALSALQGAEGPWEVGALRQYSPTVVLALHIAECLVRSPVALAALLEVAGPLAKERVGQILARRPTLPPG